MEGKGCKNYLFFPFLPSFIYAWLANIHKLNIKLNMNILCEVKFYKLTDEEFISDVCWGFIRNVNVIHIKYWFIESNPSRFQEILL